MLFFLEELNNSQLVPILTPSPPSTISLYSLFA